MDNNAKMFQNEYAMFVAVSDLFHIVKTRSMKINSLKIYFKELSGCKNEGEDENKDGKHSVRKNTREALVDRFKDLVERNVREYVDFPMMESCAAEVFIYQEKDGSHTFAFTDGMYGFMVHLEFSKGRNGNKFVKGIRVMDLEGNLLNAGTFSRGHKAAA